MLLIDAADVAAVAAACRAAGRHMVARGSGRIINVASLLTFFGGITVPGYAASKGAVGQLTKALSNEWAGKGVNVAMTVSGPSIRLSSVGTNIRNAASRPAGITTLLGNSG